MRRLIVRWSLGIALAVGSPAVGEDVEPTVEDDPSEAATAAKPSDAVEERSGWRSWLVPALQRLRLNPGHDHVDRAAASRLRP
jgi:hypothetical protein